LTAERLKILMIAPTPYFVDRGCHVRIYEEAKTLRQRGHDVRIVTYHLGRDMPGIPTYRIPRVPWYSKLSAGPSWHKPYLDILLFLKALKAARKFRPDIIHAHLHEGASVGIVLKKILKIPLLFDYQGSLTGEVTDHGFISAGSALHAAFSRIEKFIDRSADVIVTSSGPGAGELIDKWGVPRDRVHVLMDGVDCSVFRPFPKEEARMALRLPVGRPLAVFLGVLNRYQGVDLLMEAVGILKQKGADLHFLVMGFPDEGYRKLAFDMGISDRMTFTGRVDYGKAPFYLSAADMAVSPKVSPSEANGKMFNYMACGLPTVAFESPVNREILGDAGRYARLGDAGDLAAVLASLLANSVERSELGRQARLKAESEHSWEARGAVLENILLELCRSSRGNNGN
jgi:glycosyltransferase involved in cell wall biosynthesis